MKNYHTHTYRCHHASGSEEEYIKAAIKSGYTVLGFSDHSPWRYDSSYVSHMRMKEGELEGYIKTLLKLKEKYKNQIDIKIGLECEYFEKYIPWLKETLKTYPIDYIILGNHFDDTDETGIYYGRPLPKEKLKKYVDDCIHAMETGLYSYIAHPDLVHYNRDDPFYTKEMTRLCLEAKKHNMPLEFNLLGFSEHRQYPNNVFFNIVKEVGNKVIIGVDAHESQALADTKTYDKAKQYLEQLGVEVIEDIQYLR